jgi:hypothetical protein
MANPDYSSKVVSERGKQTQREDKAKSACSGFKLFHLFQRFQWRIPGTRLERFGTCAGSPPNLEPMRQAQGVL